MAISSMMRSLLLQLTQELCYWRRRGEGLPLHYHIGLWWQSHGKPVGLWSRVVGSVLGLLEHGPHFQHRAGLLHHNGGSTTRAM